MNTLGDTLEYNSADLKVERMLGAGGYGSVYMCSLKSDPTQTVAVKCMFVVESTDFVFSWREIDIAKKMNHPRVTKLIGYCKMSGSEMELLEGVGAGERRDDICLVFPVATCSLDSLTDLQTRPEKEIINMFCQVLSGLSYIHKCGYIHRDIKPQNILCMEDGSVKICDFGIAEKMIRNNHLSSGSGSQHFRAPEMLLDTGVCSYACDVWSAGCLLYYMMSKNYIDPDVLLKTTPMMEELQNIISSYPFPIHVPTNERVAGIDYTCKADVNVFFSRITTKLRTPHILLRFLSSMLSLQATARPTVDSLLSHAYITKTATNLAVETSHYFIISEECRVLKACDKTVMSAVESCVLDVFQYSRKECWYQDKVLFTALMMFDRLSNIADKFSQLDPSEWRVYFKTCLYISAKYYAASYSYGLKYQTFCLPNESANTLIKAKLFEDTTTHILGGWIYDVSPYDILVGEKLPHVSEIFSMLLLMLRREHDGKTARETYLSWLQQQDHLLVSAKKHERYQTMTMAR